MTACALQTARHPAPPVVPARLRARATRPYHASSTRSLDSTAPSVRGAGSRCLRDRLRPANRPPLQAFDDGEELGVVGHALEDVLDGAGFVDHKKDAIGHRPVAGFDRTVISGH